MHSQLITSNSMDETKIVKNILSIVMMMVDVEDLQHRSVYFPWYNYVRNVIYIYKNSSSADVVFFSWALPNTNCHSPSKKHVKKIFDFMCELKAITFSHYCMPGWTKLFVHAFFYHFCSSLQTQQSAHLNNDNDDDNDKIIHFPFLFIALSFCSRGGLKDLSQNWVIITLTMMILLFFFIFLLLLSYD